MRYQHETQACLPVITEAEFERGGHLGWPARDEADVAALKAVATLFGAEISWEPLSRRPFSTRSRGVVLTTRAAEREAILYASLTNRHVIRSADQAALARAPDGVVVGERAFFDTTTLSALLARAPAAPILGLIWGEPGADLRRQVLARSAARYLSRHPKAGRVIEIYPTASDGWRVSGTWATTGAAADPKQLRAALTGSGNAAVAVLSHSDGVDALIHRQLTLCPVSGRRSRGGAGEVAPYCVQTGRCFRHGIDVNEMVSSENGLSPREIVSRVLVLAICHGLMPDDTIVDRQWRIADQIVSAFNVGALVTSVSVVLPSPQITGELLRALATGAPLGRAVQRIHLRKPARATDFRLLVIGDPDIRIISATRPAETPRRLSNRRPPPKPLTFLRAYITNAMVRAPERLTDLARQALEAVQLFEFSEWRGLPDSSEPDSPGASMRCAILDYITARGPVISHDWIDFAKTIAPSAALRCWTCGARLTVLRTSFRIDAADRRLGICPRCGVVEDAPWESHIGMRVSGSVVELMGLKISPRWEARLTVAPPDDTRNSGIAWKRRADGRPTARMRIPADIGYAKVSVALMDGTNVTVLQAPAMLDGGGVTVLPPAEAV